ncbi:MAG: response regulator transcription factor [Dehalococcoidia bacterium]|nr:response regulator transcription factor [Dehalococcoidia bacterium]
MGNPIRVVIAEDHAVVREGTRQILTSDPHIEVVGEADDGGQVLDLVAQLVPDVVVLDLRLPVVTGIEVARRLQAAGSSTRILVLSAYDDDDYIFAAMDAGVAGYLLKTAHGEEVIDAIHAIARGDVVLQSAVAAKFIRRRPPERTPLSQEEELTSRELEILRLAALGLRNKEIADRLFLSQRTVEGHLSHVFAKMAVGSRTEAIVYAAARGWLVIPGVAP